MKIEERIEKLEKQQAECLKATNDIYEKLAVHFFQTDLFPDVKPPLQRDAAGNRYVVINNIRHYLPDTSPPPFKFEVGQAVRYRDRGSAARGLPGTIQARELRGCPVYCVNDLWFSEDVLVAIPPPSRFKVGDWVRCRYGAVGRVMFSENGPTHLTVMDTTGAKFGAPPEWFEPWTPREGEWCMWQRGGVCEGGPFEFRAGYFSPGNVAIPAPIGPQAKEWFA